MIRIVENINTNSLKPNIQKIINDILSNLDEHVIVTYIDETLMPNELSIEIAWEYQPNNEEYLGTWEINMTDKSKYSQQIQNISSEIYSAYSFIENSK